MAKDKEAETESFTRLVDKHYSPMVLRKTTILGFPIYVALITDDDLSNLDVVINRFIADNKKGWTDNIQKIRNFVGGLVEHLREAYPKLEGAAVIAYADKCLVSSLHGDYMNHNSCKLELYQSLNLLPHI